MKVLMFCPQFAPVIGGAERQAEKLGVEMAARGLDVDLWTPQIVPGTPASQAIGGMQVIRFPLQDLSKAFPRIRGIGAINGPWIAMQIMYRIWRAVGAADVVHCHIGSLQTVAAACAARLRGVAAAAYQRTKNEYSLEAVAEKYIGLYQDLKDRKEIS